MKPNNTPQVFTSPVVHVEAAFVLHWAISESISLSLLTAQLQLFSLSSSFLAFSLYHMPSLAAKARLALQRLHLRSSKQSSEVADTMSVPESADYIIVGGGTAGLVIANRLSEDSKVSVLVLEAGTNHLDDPNVNVPAFWTQLIGTDVDWQLKTVTQVRMSPCTSSTLQIDQH